MTEAILEKKSSGLPPFRVSSLERPHPSSVRRQRGCARRRLTEDLVRPPPATVGSRQTGDKARTDGIGDAREHGADDAAELAFHVNKIPISVAIEGRGAEEMAGWCCVEIGPIRASHPYIGGNRRWTC
jgi:hypothetical protein